MREGEAPSYFNPVEAAVLVGLVTGLLQQHARSAAGIRAGDIGVIATYRKQVAGSARGPGGSGFSQCFLAGTLFMRALLLRR